MRTERAANGAVLLRQRAVLRVARIQRLLDASAGSACVLNKLRLGFVKVRVDGESARLVRVSGTIEEPSGGEHRHFARRVFQLKRRNSWDA